MKSGKNIKNRRTGKRKNRKSSWKRFLLVFLITLLVILLAGFTGMIAYEYTIKENEALAEEELVAELVQKIPEAVAAEPSEEPMSPYADILADSTYMKENRIYAKEPSTAGEVTLCFAGDILFDDEYAVMATAIQKGGTVNQAFSEDLLLRMQEADIMMLNNEFPYTDRGTALENKQYTFRADPSMTDWLSDMGVDIVSLANNHTFDFGETGLLDTLETLHTADIPYVGAGQNSKEAMAPVYYIVGDIKIAFIAATQIERLDNPDTRGATDALSGVFRCWNPEKLCEAVTEAKKVSDFVIVYIHWGTENESEQDWAQLDQAPQIAEAGADLIIGAHPHCLQGITYHGNVPVVYSLGNFWFSSRQVDTGMIEVTLDKNGLKSLQFIPALQVNCVTSLLYGAEKDAVIQTMRLLSPEIQIDNEGFIKTRLRKY